MRVKALLIILVLTFAARSAWAVKVADITRISGQRSNVLTGMGLVLGLKGTGDGGDFGPAIRPLVSMLRKMGNPVTEQDLQDASNVALVTITVTIPPHGAHAGDRLDVYVTSMGAASSLRGGRLFITPLLGPTGDAWIDPETGQPMPFALAEGAIELEDPASPQVGVIKGGAVMEADLPAHYIENGRLTLILEAPAADWTTASAIAKIINDAENTAGEILAVAKSATVVEVIIPPSERERPDSFISRVQRLPVPMLPTEARVVINERTGTMVLTGDVEISPVVISHRGLTITTVRPEPVPSPRNPVVDSRNVIAMDTTGQGGAKLRDLVAAMDQLKVPAQDRITIIKELHKTGKLHAKLIVERQ